MKWKPAMNNVSDEHEYTTYPRRFITYKWFRPLIVLAFFAVFFVAFNLLASVISKLVFGAGAVSETAGYDGRDFYTAAGAFKNGAEAFSYIPSLLLAALIVKDRPISSYFSSMGGWRWKSFLKAFAAAFVILGIPTIVSILIKEQAGPVKFTAGGFLIMAVMVLFQGLAEEMVYRGFITQTVSSWFNMAIPGIAVQIVFFTLVHPYNLVGRVEIAVSALLYMLSCVFTRGLEAPTAMHIVNNSTVIFMTGFGFGAISSEQTIPSVVLNLAHKVLFLLFILYASKKWHWFDETKRDDATEWNAKMTK